MPFPHANNAPFPPPSDFTTDTAFGESYTMIRELGRGGMAIVYLMRERATGLERAVKVIHTKYLDDDEALARFSREARVVALLDHPNIVATHSVRWIDGVGFGLVMDHVPGRTLKQILRDDPPIPFARAMQILDDIAAGLGYAHERGIVHRDVKPENIFVEEASGNALLADFGIARSAQHDNEVTVAGVAIGTPTYMAPEQIDGSAVDARSDLFSLGLVGWEMLTGRRPWDGETLYNVIYHQKHDQLAAIDALRPGTPARIVYAIEGLLDKLPAARWQTAAEFRAELASTDPVIRKQPQRSVPAPDETVAIAISPAMKVRGRIRRVAPTGAIAALLLGATFLFAWPSSTGFIRDGKPVATEVDVKSAPAVLHAPIANYGATDSVATSVVSPTDSAASLTASQAAAARATPAPPAQRAAADSAAALAAARNLQHALPPIIPTTGAPPAATTVQDTHAASVGAAPTAVPAASPGGKLSIAAGGAHTCLIESSGSTYCWGANNAGQLGTGATQTIATPTAVAGATHFSTIAPGLSHTCALTSRGVAYCWGNNEHGQLGDGGHAARDVPARVTFSQSLTSIVSGAGYSCAIGGDGQTYCWGAGARGQIGNGAPDDRTAPTRIAATVSFTSLAAGWNHVCGLSDGVAYCWGANDAGQLGDGTIADHSVPTQVRTSARFASLSAGSAHTCGTTGSGVVYCWGDNKYGQLGDGTQTAHSTPVAVDASARFASVSGGSVHTCAVTQSHEAWCWGRNTYGQLGDGTEVSRSTPVQVSGGHDFTSVKAFGSHTCGTTISDELFCWGYNLDGQLGDGTREHRLRPTYIQKPTG
jgi:alpha-tubulin suppressor-like RCC1 family protein/tRNA A-37 threonylcarbamoyl transferase component Bud32